MATLFSIFIVITSCFAEEYDEIFAAFACFSAVDYKASTIFHAPKNGEIIGITLTYMSGGVKCQSGSSFTNWGCNDKFRIQLLRVTDKSTFYGEQYYPTSITQDVTIHNWLSCSRGCETYTWSMTQYDTNSPEFTLLHPSYNVTKNESFMLQYSEACCQHTLSDNAGTACGQIDFLYTYEPTSEPSHQPTLAPTLAPTLEPTLEPTLQPTPAPSLSPSVSPSTPPTLAPSGSPTQPPTRAPTPICSNLEIIMVSWSTGDTIPDDIKHVFEGFYTFQYEKQSNGRPIFEVSQMPNDKNIQYVGVTPNGYWIINAQGTASLQYGPTDLQYPPCNQQSDGWIHNDNSIAGSFTIFINCVDSFAPINAPTAAPTVPPTTAPSKQPSLAPTNIPSQLPTNAPFSFPTNVPSAAPVVSESCDFLVITHNDTSQPLLDLFIGRYQYEITNNIWRKNVGDGKYYTLSTDGSNNWYIRNNVGNGYEIKVQGDRLRPPYHSEKWRFTNIIDLDTNYSLTIDCTDNVTPSNAPSMIPTLSPTTFPLISIIPTNGGDISTTTIPTKAPTQYRELYFICYYNDDKDSSLIYLSLSEYAQKMEDAILYSIPLVLLQNIDYDEMEPNPLTKWGRAGIKHFIICAVFDNELKHSDIECPSYNTDDDGDDDDDGYIAIGIFDIMADKSLNKYQEKLIDVMTSKQFKQEFSKNMKQRMSNIATKTRRLLQGDSFEVVRIVIIDPLNTTTSTSEDEDEFTNQDKDESVTMTVFIVVVVSLVLMIAIMIIVYWKKYKKPNGKIMPNIEGAGAAYHGENIEIQKIPNNTLEVVHQVLTGNDGEIEANNDEVDNLKNENKDQLDVEIVNEINKTQIDEYQQDKDDGHIDIVNAIHNNVNKKETDSDIIEAINETAIEHENDIEHEHINIDNISENDIIDEINKTQDGSHNMLQ